MQRLNGRSRGRTQTSVDLPRMLCDRGSDRGSDRGGGSL
jgi:hypothetical protein